MLADIDLDGCLIVIAGAGAQAYKRAKSLLAENCRILVVGEHVDSRLEELGCEQMTIRRQKIEDASFIRGCGARIVIAATSDDELNAMIANAARREPNCLAYSADGSSPSDYSHVATSRLSETVEFAVSTHGQSPAMAKSLRDRAAESLAGLVTGHDESRIALYSELRSEAKRRISAPSERRRFLQAIAVDAGVQELIKDGQAGAAQMRAMSILDGWDNAKDHS